MADVRLIDVDIAARANGKIPVWNSTSGTHEYTDPASSAAPANRAARIWICINDHS